MNSEVNECKNKSFIKQHLFFHKHEGNLQQKHGITFLFGDNFRERETELVIDYLFQTMHLYMTNW